ncbi:IS3 family transposase [Catenulispora sp. NF23]|uniref:IS3 family transposase n=1 Tax=Catenulispora pinistramenti TaxID=2705254 RepID=UPI001BA763B1|nr:IS3 family transposase [Catenulispora pinistramenti]MBS2532753.1 IS3 family transposase [Catenulispora pinistramenti]
MSSGRSGRRPRRRHDQATRQELANAPFEYIEAWYNPHRRLSTIGMLSPAQFEQTHALTVRRERTGLVRETRGKLT